MKAASARRSASTVAIVAVGLWLPISPFAASLGFVALQGACFETDRAHPYAPVLDLVRVLSATASPALERRPAGSDGMFFSGIVTITTSSGAGPSFPSALVIELNTE